LPFPCFGFSVGGGGGGKGRARWKGAGHGSVGSDGGVQRVDDGLQPSEMGIS
jgi:hypothetical protein